MRGDVRAEADRDEAQRGRRDRPGQFRPGGIRRRPRRAHPGAGGRQQEAEDFLRGRRRALPIPKNVRRLRLRLPARPEQSGGHGSGKPQVHGRRVQRAVRGNAGGRENPFGRGDGHGRGQGWQDGLLRHLRGFARQFEAGKGRESAGIQDEALFLLFAPHHRRGRLPSGRPRGRQSLVRVDSEALRSEINDHHDEHLPLQMGRDVRGRDGRQRDAGPAASPQQSLHHKRAVFQNEGLHRVQTGARRKKLVILYTFTFVKMYK